MEPSELVQALAAETLPHDEFDYPRLKADGTPVGRVRMQLISVQHELEAKRRGIDKLKKDPRITADVIDTQAAQDLLGDYVAHEVIAMSCRSTVNKGTDKKPHYPFLFGNTKNLEEHATRDEIDWLWQQYLVLRAKCGVWHMENVSSEEAVATWARRLESEQSAAPLCSLVSQDLVILAYMSLRTVRMLAHALASQVENSETSLASSLEIFMEGTSYFGGSPDIGSSKPGELPGSEPQSLANEGKDPESALSAQLDAEGKTLTFEEAREIAKKL